MREVTRDTIRGTNYDDWINDCNHFYGHILKGLGCHWCPDWDGLPIDETCP